MSDKEEAATADATQDKAALSRVIYLVVNRLLSLNRLGRGCATLFLILSYGVARERFPLWQHLVLAHTAALWYCGFNDIRDYAVDLRAHGTSRPRKVLLCGAMSVRELWWWLAGTTAASFYFLHAAGLGPLPLGLFGGGLASSVIYNLKSKYSATPRLDKSIALDVIVSGPYFLHYLCFATASGVSALSFESLAIVGTLVMGGLYGNYLYSLKDVSTDSKGVTSLALQMGVTATGERVKQSAISRAYLLILSGLWLALNIVLLLKRLWVATPVLVYVVYTSWTVGVGGVSEKHCHVLFNWGSNMCLILLFGVFVARMPMKASLTLALLSVSHGLLNMRYHHWPQADRPRLMLKLAGGPDTASRTIT